MILHFKNQGCEKMDPILAFCDGLSGQNRPEYSQPDQNLAP